MRTKLYRHFDEFGDLLYVGISCCALKRMLGHKKKSFWFDEISKITIQNFETREAACLAEKEAIRLEKPLYNKDYNALSTDCIDSCITRGFVDILDYAFFYKWSDNKLEREISNQIQADKKISEYLGYRKFIRADELLRMKY